MYKRSQAEGSLAFSGGGSDKGVENNDQKEEEKVNKEMLLPRKRIIFEVTQEVKKMEWETTAKMQQEQADISNWI